MFCWQARPRLGELIEKRAGGPTIDAMDALERHVGTCADCRDRCERLRRVVSLLAEASLEPANAGLETRSFEDHVLRAVRARRSAMSAMPVAQPARLRPASLAAALSVMLLASGAALYVGTSGARLSASPPETERTDVISSREIPFTIEEDLVGSRRGRIPLTTYVLEPAPTEALVVRASL